MGQGLSLVRRGHPSVTPVPAAARALRLRSSTRAVALRVRGVSHQSNVSCPSDSLTSLLSFGVDDDGDDGQGIAIAIPLAGGIAGSIFTRKSVIDW